ncbi:HAMP domain-containing sensor histidine kinase [Pseudalkalibacillus salsuginis]|uniref:HAMP domain-containing sensor histidine kinase n=1 Tax=Pseudalkalibacillus salsuginis TaxID=2910972 RepID=UPI001F26D850|nr:sensor histidine kinase [Pseudalkalibacillus salsuginis]MCF6408916.1 sensor histidine kinase [Pseudalkalibacillus salsuginis]
MSQNQNGIRRLFYRTHLLNSVYTTVLIFILFQILYILYPAADRIVISLLVSIGVFVLSFMLGIYFSLRKGQTLINRLNEISVGITKLSRGNYDYRISDGEDDEVGIISAEINQLSDKIKKQVQSLQKLANEKAEYAEKAHTAATIEERQRLARDLHDAVSQQLFALNMMSSAALKLFERHPGRAKSQLEQVVEMANKAQGEMRALLLHLRPIDLSGEKLHSGIQELVNELQQKSGIEIHSEIDEIPDVSRGIEDHLFRLMQEGLANALRHSQASKITVKLDSIQKHIRIHLRDNGVGFDLNQKKKTSYGLKTMQERCDDIGGTFSITTAKGQGTAIDVRVPIGKGDEHVGQSN